MVGGSLARDLAELGLRLSRRAPEVAGSGLTIDQLAREWTVSTRTIHRWRKTGLPCCWMYRTASKRLQSLVLAVRRADASAYRRIHEAAVSSASRRKRISGLTRAAILRSAAELAQGGERRVSVASKKLASTLGISRESVRAILVKNPDATGGKFAGRRRRAIHSETVAFSIWCRGSGTSTVAARLDCSEHAAKRLVHAARAKFLQHHAGAFSPVEVEIPATFRRDDAREVILGSDAVHQNLASAAPMRNVQAWWTARCEPSSESSRRMMAVRFLWWSAQREARRLASIEFGARDLDRIETDLRWARLLARTLLVESMPTIAARVKAWAGGDVLRVPAKENRHLLENAARALVEVLRETDPVLIASARVRIDRAVALKIERGLSASDPPALIPSRLMRESTAVADPIDGVLPWQTPTEVLSKRVDRIAAGDPMRVQWYARLGWNGTSPLTLDEVAADNAMPIGVLARLLARAVDRRVAHPRGE